MSSLLDPLDFDPLTGKERDALEQWARSVNSPYTELVERMLKENMWFRERHFKYMMIGDEVLDVMVQAYIQERGGSWS